MEREVRYCTTKDGVHIAFAVFGDGDPLVVVPGWLSHLQYEWEIPEVRAFYDALASVRTVVWLDPRGTGLSDWHVADLSVEGRRLDVEAVIEALSLQSVDLLGMSHGGQTAVAYAARHPQRVRRLITYGSYARLANSTKILTPVIELVRAQWGLGSAALTSALAPNARPDDAAAFTGLQRVASDGDTAARTLEAIAVDDVTPYLKEVSAPTLVIHRQGDPVHPFRLGREMASLIPGARFEALAGDAYAPWIGDTDALLAVIFRFLGVEYVAQPTAAPTRGRPGVCTILFTDIVGHTEMMQRLGDAKGRDVLREHERITRDLLKRHGGAEVKTMGDGFMASFASVTAAMDCAVALQRAFAARDGEPLHVRVGLNAGEPIEEDGDLFGATVILASRIAAKAGPGEILIPEPVRHLLAGKSYAYADRGEYEMKGFDEAVRLWDVRWRE